MGDGSLTLALGPTNTGKTHRAVERMLEHRSGMIGLPLRLLAREVYDRISARLGERQVALVTGEEKRVPAAPRFWVCTVEAMPEVSVDFLAVDEIQLAAHRERGHVFTERLLSARGALETWLLGADTMAPALRALIPEARLERRPRLSTLRWAGSSGLGGLPPRSAVVAFSADDVYAIAARLKHRKGGAAVVLGALSPRTRNAQVALYEAREVSYLVATDAIGMGLNLDVDHVAFASAEKFDGKEQRPLDAAELAQIAGRAGRYQRDGTFGVLRPLAPFPERLVRRIEEHRFAPVERLVWRSAALDFTSVDALIRSLAAPSPLPLFTRVEQADDFDALRALAERREVRERAATEEGVRLLWEVCQIPDYRKLLLLRHVSLLEAIFVALFDSGRLDPEWAEEQVRRIDRVDGDIDTLTAQLAAIRVWTYVSHRAGWLEPSFQARTRDIEDRIGDALHAELVERFVERSPRAMVIPADVAGPFAGLGALLEDRQREGERERERWIEALIEAPHDALAIEDEEVRFRGELVGELVAGRELAAPQIALALSDEVGPGARARIERRLAAFARDLVSELCAPLAIGAQRATAAVASGATHVIETDSGPVRGLLYQLAQGLGTARERDARAQLAALSDEDRALLDAHGIELGRRTVHARAMLAPASIARRALLARLFYRVTLDPPRGAVALARERTISPDAYLAIGFVVLGTRAVRADIVERVLGRLDSLDAPFALPPEIGRWLGVRAKELPRVLAPLGYRRRDQLWEPSQERST